MRETTRTPDDYLDAALRVITGEAAPRFTLARVAQETGVSKGGLLHHYPSKDALLRALLEREYALFKMSVERQAGFFGGAPGARTRALITACFATEASGQPLMLSLLAAMFESHELLEAFRTEWADYRRSFLHDGLPEAQALLIQLALDGLYFAELLGLEPPTGRLRDDLYQTLLKLTEGEKR